jgi:hypothetical protein
MVPKRLITKIHFGGNGNHTFFVSGDIGLCVNQGTGFLAKNIHAPCKTLVCGLFQMYTMHKIIILLVKFYLNYS